MDSGSKCNGNPGLNFKNIPKYPPLAVYCKDCLERIEVDRFFKIVVDETGAMAFECHKCHTVKLIKEINARDMMYEEDR